MKSTRKRSPKKNGYGIEVFLENNALVPYSPNTMFYNHPPLCFAKNDLLKTIL